MNDLFKNKIINRLSILKLIYSTKSYSYKLLWSQHRVSPVQVAKCACTEFKVYNTVYHNETVPEQVEYFGGIFK